MRLEFRPAAEQSASYSCGQIWPDAARIPATVAQRIETPRRTTLARRRGDGGNGRARAGRAGRLADRQLRSLGRTSRNARLRRLGLPFVDLLDDAGVVDAKCLAKSMFVVRKVSRLGNDESWIEARPQPGRRHVDRYRLDYGPGNGIGRQTYQCRTTPETFRRELAPCRTFMLKTEADWLLAQGLGSGRRSRTCWCSTRRARSATSCGFATNACGTKCSIWWATWPWPVATWSGSLSAHRSGHRLNAEMVRVLLTGRGASRTATSA